ncbi:MAG: TIGR03905 family TSCPD domain-containing protein [Flavonifractor plautii]
MIIDYQPRGVCSRRMTLEVEEGVIRSIRIQGGCDGNLRGISRLVEGMEVSRPSAWTAFALRRSPLPAGSVGPGAEAVPRGE